MRGLGGHGQECLACLAPGPRHPAAPWPLPLPWHEPLAPAVLPALLGPRVCPHWSVASDHPQGPLPHRPVSRGRDSTPGAPLLSPPTRTDSPHLLVLPGGHAGLLGQGRLLGGPTAGGSAGPAGLISTGRPHGPGQHVVLLPQLTQPHALHLQRLLQLQDPHLQPGARPLSRPTASPQGPSRLPGAQPRERDRRGTGAGGGTGEGQPRAPTWVSISCFFSLMRERPEKSMVSAARGEWVSIWAPAPSPAAAPGPQHSPLSSICSWPDLVEATTLAAISLTAREHSCRRLRCGLCLSAFTWGGRTACWLQHPHAHGLPATRGAAATVGSPGARGEAHLGGRHQLGCAGRDLVGADDELLVLARVKHHPVS